MFYLSLVVFSLFLPSAMLNCEYSSSTIGLYVCFVIVFFFCVLEENFNAKKHYEESSIVNKVKTFRDFTGHYTIVNEINFTSSYNKCLFNCGV